MGSWGITERESDYGLDLLGTIVATKLKAVDFATFNVAEALDVITADIMEEIRKANRGCSDRHRVCWRKLRPGGPPHQRDYCYER